MPEEDLTPQGDDPKGLREAVERANREKAEAQSELEQLRRSEAFRNAGLNPTDPVHAAVIKGYDGGLDEVPAFVTGLGLGQPTPPPVDAHEREAMERIGNLPVGDGGGQPSDPDAEGNERLRTITMQATREKWPKQRFEDEFTAEMVRQRRPVAGMDVRTNS